MDSSLRVRTDSSQFYAPESAYNGLEYKYRHLQHEYANLEKEFQLYSSETYSKISGLEQDMDRLVADKDRAYRALSLENKNLKQENLTLQHQFQSQLNEIAKLKCRLSDEQFDVRNADLSMKHLGTVYEQKIMKLEEEVNHRISQLQSVKQILFNERISSVNKEEIIRSRDSEISRLSSDLATMQKELEASLQTESGIKETNYRLKKEVEELKSMFAELEASFTTCQNCNFLKSKNIELQAVVREYERRQGSKYKKTIHNFDEDYRDKKGHSIGSLNHSSLFQHIRIKRRELGEIRGFRNYTNEGESRQGSNVKESVLEKCRSILDRNI